MTNRRRDLPIRIWLFFCGKWSCYWSRGHTVIIIDHHLQLIDGADWIVELGPRAAEQGGKVVFNGRRQDFQRCAASATAALLQKEA